MDKNIKKIIPSLCHTANITMPIGAFMFLIDGYWNKFPAKKFMDKKQFNKIVDEEIVGKIELTKDEAFQIIEKVVKRAKELVLISHRKDK